MSGQITDGYFENYRVGDVVELDISISFGPFGYLVIARDQSMKNRVEIDIQKDGAFSRAEEYINKFPEEFGRGMDYQILEDEIAESMSADEEILCALAKKMYEARIN